MTNSYAGKIWEKFATQEGSQQVASLISIQTLEMLLERERPSRILELGSGIGTLTQVCLQKSSADLVTVENDDYCIIRLKNNTSGLRQYSLIENFSELGSGGDWDFLVIDLNDRIYNVENLIINSPKLKLVFIEGHHLAHRINISRVLYQSGRRVNLIDVREKKRTKGCAYFEIEDYSTSRSKKSLLSFVIVFVPLIYHNLFLKFRLKFALVLNRLDGFEMFSLIRKLWKGKIPWKF